MSIQSIQNNDVFIGIGSNLNNPIEQVKKALISLEKLPSTQLLKHSSLYQSSPMDFSQQPDYINAVAWLNTELSPLHLLTHLQAIEKQQGRIRTTQRWAARTLDLDLLLYGNLHYHDTTLTLPHEGLYQRAFVLYPLFECVPNLILPNGQALKDVLKLCDTQNLKKIEESASRLMQDTELKC